MATRGSRAAARTSPRRSAATDADAYEVTVLSAESTAAALAFLHAAEFGGQPEDRPFRASLASIRGISGRPRLGPAFLDEVAMHLARAGFDLVAMETYVVVQPASRHASLRRAPASLRAAARAAAIDGTARIEPVNPEPEDQE